MKIANIVLNDFTNDSRVWKVSKSLIGMGNLPVVVAMHNDGLPEDAFVGDVKVERIKLRSRPWPRWKPVQIIKYIEFVFRSVWRFRNVNVVHCNDLNALPIGILIKIFGNGVRVVYDCHEYETEVNGLKGIEKALKKWLERTLIRYADDVITVSDSISDEYVRLYNIKKPHLVLNCPPYKNQSKNDLFRDSIGIRSDQTIFLYQGGLSEGRGIEILLEAFSKLDSDRNVIVFLGYGPLLNVVKAKADNSDTIFFHPAVSPESLLDYTSSADYGVLFYEDTCLNHRYCSPNKIFEYLMAGLPVLTSNLVEVKRLIENEGVGIVAKANTVQAFQAAIIESLDKDYFSLQRNVYQARERYCWEEQEKVLKEIYNGLK